MHTLKEANKLSAAELDAIHAAHNEMIEPWHLRAYQPAEACTELGAEPCNPPVTRIGLILILLTGAPLLVAVVGVVLSLLG